MNDHGQINESTERWKLIKKILDENSFQNLVEIGTWKGMGSTLCFLKNKKDNCTFTSLEFNHANYQIAKNNLSKFEDKLNLIYGRIVEIEDVDRFISDINLSEEQRRWLEGDVSDFGKTQNVIDQIPNKIDFLLLDGGEFSTYPEWVKLKDRTEFVALDDIRVLKTKKIYEELSLDNDYVLLDITEEGNGFCIFKKIKNNN
jgi:hypothetical protein